MLRISRTNMSVLGVWWYTVDRWMLFAIIFLGCIGLFFSLAISPAEAISIKTNTYFFLTRHFIYFFISLFFLVSISILDLNLPTNTSIALLSAKLSVSSSFLLSSIEFAISSLVKVI